MLINYIPGEECRIAITTDGKLEELYQERQSSQSHVGNIYQGKVLNVEPAISAVFIDFGIERNGFLHITDVHPMYFPGKDRELFENVGNKTPHHQRPPIQKCFKRGQDVLVQVLKEGIGTKGPTLTSYLSIPGRFLVMMPYMQRLGVSRKVEDDEARREMREILSDLNPPEDFGFIIRTAGMGQTKSELKRDMAYLLRLWKNIERRRGNSRKTGELYTESDLVIRTIRDIYTPDIERIVVDNAAAARRSYDFLSIASPRSRSSVVHYTGKLPLFHRFDVERQIEGIYERTVPLPSGGSLVIDQTEALVAIDVNSGKSRSARDAETNAYNTNLEAVDEICRQLRLRDLGGVIVNDLIDMLNGGHRKQVEQRMRDNLKRDRARTRVASISMFGTLELTRQRMRPSLKSALTIPCASCDGSGLVKNSESVVLDVMRRMAKAMDHSDVTGLELVISPDVAFHLLNRKRAHLVDLEQRFGKPVTVRVGGSRVDYVEIHAVDERGAAVDLDAAAKTAEHKTEGDDFAIVTTNTSPQEPQTDVMTDEEENDPDAEAAAPDPVDDVEQGQSQDEQSHDPPRRRRRRRGGRRRKKAPSDEGEAAETESADTATSTAEAAADAAPSPSDENPDDDSSNGEQKKKRRRRGGRGRRKKNPADPSSNANESASKPAGESSGDNSSSGSYSNTQTQTTPVAESTGTAADVGEASL